MQKKRVAFTIESQKYVFYLIYTNFNVKNCISPFIWFSGGGKKGCRSVLMHTC